MHSICELCSHQDLLTAEKTYSYLLLINYNNKNRFVYHIDEHAVHQFDLILSVPGTSCESGLQVHIL